MPKRSNFFQRLVRDIERAMQPSNANVTESKTFKNLITGATREVDIAIEFPGPHPSIIAIECRDQRRRQTVEWVEEVYGKYRDLPPNKVVLVSRSGFTKDALKEAKAYGYEALTIGDPVDFNWPTTFGKLRTVEFVQLQINIKHVVVEPLLLIESERRRKFKSVAQKILYTRQGKSLGEILEFAKSRLNRPDFVDWLEKQHPLPRVVRVCVPLPSGTYIRWRRKTKRTIKAIGIDVELKKEIVSLDVEHKAFAGVPIAIAAGKMGDKEVCSVATQQADGTPTITLRIEPKAQEKSGTKKNGASSV